MIEFLWAPLLACLVLTGIHVYLGLHVLARGVIFVDLALAQVAALGVAVAFLVGHPITSDAAYWYALAFTLGGALVFAASRTRRASVPQEAIIGIVYAVSAAAAVLVVDRAPQGGEHIKQLLVGSILTVTPGEVGGLALLYTLVGALHWIVRRPMLEISLDADGARARGRRVAAWDFVFYASFGLVVTSSVRLAGVLLVFCYLVVPATVAALLARSVGGRLAVGWGFGIAVSVLGLIASSVSDLPTGATVVVTFGGLLAAVGLAVAARRMVLAVRAAGLRALTGLGLGLAVLACLAGLLLLALPNIDHLWLRWLESAVPGVRTAFLTADEREMHADSVETLARGVAELERLHAMHQDVQWGTRQMSEEMQERLRQYLASRGELVAGDRVVLETLERRARARQRFWLGIPLAAAGAAAAIALWRLRGALSARSGRTPGRSSARAAPPRPSA
jgi:zinc/manganese transport system permease protein